MKRLFSKTMLGALIISLAPAQSTQAKILSKNIVPAIGFALLGGAIGSCISNYIHHYYRQKAADKTQGLNLIINATNQQFSNNTWQRNQPGLEGHWNEERIRGVVMSRALDLSKDEANTLSNLIKRYIKKAQPQTKQAIINFCQTRIPAAPQNQTKLSRIVLPIIGGICGFILNNRPF